MSECNANLVTHFFPTDRPTCQVHGENKFTKKNHIISAELHMTEQTNIILFASSCQFPVPNEGLAGEQEVVSGSNCACRPGFADCCSID